MSLRADVSYSIRAMRKSPGVTAVAVVALALGIGANTGIFTAVNSVLLNSAALRWLRDPGRMVMVWEKNPALMAFIAERMPAAIGNFREWKRQSQTLQDMTAYATSTVVLSEPATAAARLRRVDAGEAPPEFFDSLGVKLAKGRAFTAEEAREGAPVAILSDSLYQSRFGPDPNLTGKTIRVNGVERSIIGVLPERFQLPGVWGGFDQHKLDVWTPVDFARATSDEELWPRRFFVFARVRRGLDLDQVRAEMAVINKRLAEAYPEPNKGFGVNVSPVAVEDAGPDIRRSLYILQAAVGFVLLISCANVANLLLARAVGREREIAVRLALGAPRSRIVRLVLTESLMLSLAAGVLGVLFGYWSLNAIAAMAPKDMHGFHEMRLDPLALGFSLLLAVGAGALFGLAPALHSARQNLNQTLTRGARGSSGRSAGVRNAMIVVEVALAVVLLVGAGLTIRSLGRLAAVDPGFRVDHLLTAQVTLADPSSPKGVSKDKARVYCGQLLERLAQLPGVTSVSVSSGLPMESISQQDYEVEGGAPAKDKGLRVATVNNVSEGYFRTLGIPIRRGRDFTREEAEAKQAAVIVVNEPFAAVNWPNQDPLGKVVLLPNGDQPKLRARIIGVAAATHDLGPDAEAMASMFVPSRAHSDLNLAIRVAGDPMALAPAVEKAATGLDAQAIFQQARDMRVVLHNWLNQRRYMMTILAIFAGLALVLASLGLYGVLSYLVSLRTRELGIRMALGADAARVVRLVMGQGMKLTLAGVAIGLGAALALGRFISGLLFGVEATDPLTFAVVAGALLAIAVAATLVPARRAAAVDPIIALRSE
ncbi:MAG: ABC transporter permease [Acidobacteria bacterium]|nr:ABC transporter permease [Acidobacteriota bacterium]